MSAIVGILHLDGRPVSPQDVAKMLWVQRHRGEDGLGVHVDGPVGFGHRLRCSTPESLAERQPFRSFDGDLVIVADARLDNREELIRMLSLRHRERSTLTDSEILLLAYQTWGSRCVEHLLGDFVFAVWDRQNRTLFCARDHFGVRPFYYALQPGRLLAFSSEIKGLLALDGVPRALDEMRIADFLRVNVEDQEITFYEAVQRLPPAHVLSVMVTGSVRKSCYWQLDPEHEVRLGSNQEYADAFRELFADAVRCRMRSAFAIGSTLSGGLDSSSIACMGRRLLAENRTGEQLHTFSWVFPTMPQCDEQAFIEPVVRLDGLIPHYILADRLSPIEDLQTFLWHQDEPCWIYNYSFTWETYRTAARAGVRVLMSGYGGDTTVSHGGPRIAELFRSGRWIELGVSIARIARDYQVPAWGVLKYGAVRPSLPPKLLKLWRSVRRRSGVPGVQQPVGFRRIVHPELAARTDLDARTQRLRPYDPSVESSSKSEHYQLVTRKKSASAFEINNRIGAAFGVEPAYPFFDKRLVEFCYGVPAVQKHYRGWGRMIMRRGMCSVLPDEVRWRGGKGNMEHHFYHALLAKERPRLEAALEDSAKRLQAYVDMSALRECFRVYSTGEQPRNGMFLWPPLMLSEWLALREAPEETFENGGRRPPAALVAV